MNLKQARFMKNFTQYDLMAKTGIHQSVISQIERGYYAPNEGQKKKLAKALNCRMSEVFSEDDHHASS